MRGPRPPSSVKIIRWTRNDAGLEFVNSQTAEVMAVRNGRVTFRLEDERMLDMTAGDPQLRDVDCAWALTAHTFQSRNFDRMIAALEANHRNLTNQKMPYVEIRRVRDRAEFVTDDREALRKRFQALTGERIAALTAAGESKGKGRTRRNDETGAWKSRMTQSGQPDGR